MLDLSLGIALGIGDDEFDIKFFGLLLQGAIEHDDELRRKVEQRHSNERLFALRVSGGCGV